LTALETKIKQDIDNDIKKQLEEIKAESLKVKKLLVGTNGALPAADCAAIKIARPNSEDGIYFIESKYQSAPIMVWCATVGGKFVNLGGDCKSKATACASCMNNWFSTSDESRWIDPDSDANDPGNSKKITCEANLMIKLVTTDSNTADWDNGFWSSGSRKSKDKAGASKWKAHRGDIKGDGYYSAIGKSIEIIALKGTEEIGKAVYNIKSQYQKRSLKWLIHEQGSSNLVFASKDVSKSTSGKPIFSNHMKQRGGNHGQSPFDMFIDTDADLVAKQRNYGGSHDSWSRLSTTDRSGWKGCHVYTGIGGRHRCHSWRIAFESSPIVGYCHTYNRYGSNNRYVGGHSPLHHCGGDKRQSNIDFAILKR
jgi:hypothetical protein